MVWGTEKTSVFCENLALAVVGGRSRIGLKCSNRAMLAHGVSYSVSNNDIEENPCSCSSLSSWILVVTKLYLVKTL